MSESDQSPERALILAPTGNDSTLAAEVLRSAGISAQSCGSATLLCEAMEKDCGVAIISEEALTTDVIERLQSMLEKQETWSDLPIILLTSADVVRATEIFSKSGNIFLLEKPFSRLTLIRSVEVALRSRRKQYQVRDLLKELHASKEEAERANLAKTQFLANMSHEIRTPIGAIMGFIDLMRTSQVDSTEIKRYTGIIDRNSHQLLRLIDDILDLTKVEVGKMPIEHLNVHFGEFLTDLVSVFHLKASEKSLLFHTKLESMVPDLILTDPVRLKQILSNVLGNAIKFTERGSVELAISFEAPFLKFSVKDSGVGLSSEQAAKLFKPFAQADSSTTRKFGGSGLGLVLSKKLAQALGGDLVLESSLPKEGSVFTIHIKPGVQNEARMIDQDALLSSTSTAPMPEEPPMLKGMKVLLVEDSIDNQTLISLFLKKSGARVDVRSNGAEGVEAALSSGYDLILMDVQMPVMDGHEAIQALRMRQYSKPIIALTAHAMIEEKNKCFVSGFTDYLTKPVQREHLINMLSRYLPTDVA